MTKQPSKVKCKHEWIENPMLNIKICNKCREKEPIIKVNYKPTYETT